MPHSALSAPSFLWSSERNGRSRSGAIFGSANKPKGLKANIRTQYMFPVTNNCLANDGFRDIDFKQIIRQPWCFDR